MPSSFPGCSNCRIIFLSETGHLFLNVAKNFCRLSFSSHNSPKQHTISLMSCNNSIYSVGSKNEVILTPPPFPHMTLDSPSQYQPLSSNLCLSWANGFVKCPRYFCCCCGGLGGSKGGCQLGERTFFFVTISVYYLLALILIGQPIN